MEKKNKLIILGVIILLLIASGITYAILTWNSTMIKLGINTNCFTINYAKGNNISGSLKLINEEDLINNNKFTIKEGVGVSGVNIGIKSTCSIEGYGNILLNITNISSVFTTGDSKGALKYAVLKNTSTITDPTQISTTSLLNQSFDIEKKGSITTSDTLKLLTKQLSNTELYKYIIVIYVDNNPAGNDITSATFQGNISADATQGKAPYEGLAKLIANDTFTPNKTVPNNSIDYKYDTTHSLMEDIDGNIRYYGASPNNYIYFNCDDYSNQSSSTCEVWRIIGVFEGKVKIMRGSQIGRLAWDQDKNIDSSKTTYDNDWSTSSLQVLLNTSYLNRTANVTYYSGSSGTTTTTVSTSTIGIKDSTRNMISETMWYLRGWNATTVYVDQMYEYERTTGKVYNTTRPTSWTGKIALAYPSDYGYAADLSLCQKQLGSYSDATCTANNWMKTIIAPNFGWLLTPNSGHANYAWYVPSASNVNNYGNTSDAYGVAPVLYLGSELEIKAGDGLNSAPYQLSA